MRQTACLWGIDGIKLCNQLRGFHTVCIKKSESEECKHETNLILGF